MGEIRPGSKTLETVLKTDELYGHDGLWLGPRGRDSHREPKGSKPVARIGSPGLAQMTRRAPECPAPGSGSACPWEAITAGDGLPAAV
jgi:hypothetical protein